MRWLWNKIRGYCLPRREGEWVIGWWEKRRIPYNLILFGWLTLNDSYGSKAIFQVPANIWYTGGWLMELLVGLTFRRDFRRFGPIAIAFGTVFSFAFVSYFLSVLNAVHDY